VAIEFLSADAFSARTAATRLQAMISRLSEVRLAGILASPSGRFPMSRHPVNIVYRINGQSFEIGQSDLP
jgi:hypothetical protein